MDQHIYKDKERSIGVLVFGIPLFIFALIALREVFWKFTYLSEAIIDSRSPLSLISFYYKHLFIFLFAFVLFVNLGINILRLRKRVRLFLLIFCVIYIFLLSFIFTKIWLDGIEGKIMSVRMVYYVNRVIVPAWILLFYCIIAIHFFNNSKVKSQFNREGILEKVRSPGMTIIGWLEILIGSYYFLFNILLAFRLLLCGDVSNRIILLPKWFGFICGVYFLLAGVLILRLKRLGRVMNLIGLYIYLVWQLRALIITWPYEISLDLLTVIYLPKVVVVSLLIYYFMQPEVKSQFSFSRF
jgi:hypothetical protein